MRSQVLGVLRLKPMLFGTQEREEYREIPRHFFPEQLENHLLRL